MPAAATIDDLDLGQVYRDARERITGLLRGAPESRLATRVEACPAWTVHDVVSHLVAVAEDVLAGRLTGPPDDAHTAEQVERRRGRATDEILDEWTGLAPPFEELLTGVRIWPGALDVLTHEQDIRGAIGVPGGRETDGVVVGTHYLLTHLSPPEPLRVVIDGEHFDVGGEDPTTEVRTTSFEAFRFRLGRRSRAQMAAMEWTGDSSRYLDHLSIFPPSVTDIVE